MATDLLERAFAEARRLPDDEQRELAAWILSELDAEERWSALLSGTTDVLDRLADEALGELESGQTQELDIESL